MSYLVWFALILGGGIVGLSSLNPGPDGKWTVTQIPCHAGNTHNEFKKYKEYFNPQIFGSASRGWIHKSAFKTKNRYRYLSRSSFV